MRYELSISGGSWFRDPADPTGFSQESACAWLGDHDYIKSAKGWQGALTANINATREAGLDEVDGLTLMVVSQSLHTCGQRREFEQDKIKNIRIRYCH